MSRLALCAALAVSVAPWATARADTDEDKALEKVEEIKGRVERDDKAAGKPVVGVDLRGADVTADVLKALRAFKKLRVLRLWHAPVTDEMLDEVKALSSLEVLELDATKVTDEGLPKLAALKSLRNLSLYRVGLTDEGLKGLAALEGRGKTPGRSSGQGEQAVPVGLPPAALLQRFDGHQRLGVVGVPAHAPALDPLPGRLAH
jgi:hypothetical protein